MYYACLKVLRTLLCYALFWIFAFQHIVHTTGWHVYAFQDIHKTETCWQSKIRKPHVTIVNVPD